VTGGFPPGARAGQSFVHDAKCIGQTTVKANVKLRFTSRAGQSMVVVRSMELTQRKLKATFKQLDGVLRMIDPDTGERVSLSHKCSELDKQIPQLLGISAPILEHVIFCHQEDSSWPLQDGAVLKKKFDEIFDSTRYTKALDVLKKTEKDLQTKAKDIKAELEGLKSHKHAAEQFRRDYNEHNDQLTGVDETKSEINKNLNTIKADIEKYQEIIRQVEDFENLIESRRNEIGQEHILIKKQKAMLETDLTSKHKLAEIKEMLQTYDDEVTDKLVQQKEQLENTLKTLLADIDNFRNEEMSVTSSVGKFQAEKDAHEQRLRTRYHQMEAIASKYSVDLNVTQLSQLQQTLTQDSTMMNSTSATPASPGFSTQGDNEAIMLSISPADMKAFFDALGRKENELNENLKSLRERYQNESDLIQVALTDIGGKLRSIENGTSCFCRLKYAWQVVLAD
jgi:DNA repair protein RAD50